MIPGPQDPTRMYLFPVRGGPGGFKIYTHRPTKGLEIFSE